MRHNTGGWQTIGTQTVYVGRLSIVRDRLRMPTGLETDYTWMRNKEAAAVLAFSSDRQVILTRQYRHPLHRFILDLPAGGVRPDETPIEAASRELAEETGYRTEELLPLGRFFPSPGMTSYSVHVFVAETVERGDPMPDPEELIDVVLLGWEEVIRLVRMQEPVDVTLAYAVLRYGLEA